jgi:hypothetical protein
MERLNLRAVWINTFAVFRGDAGALLLLALVLEGGGAVAAQWIYEAMAPALKATPLLGLVPWAVGFAPFVLADAAIVVVVLVALGGGRGALGFSLLAALGFLPTAVAIDLLENAPDIIQQFFPGLQASELGDLISLASILLGIAWNVPWMPALAIAAEEHLGPIATARRSLALMKGEWWRVLSFTLPVHLTVFLPRVMLEIVAATFHIGIPAWIVILASTPFFALGSVTQATLYWELARMKDGVAPRQLGAVFD